MAKPALLRVEYLKKSYGSVEAVRGVSFELSEGGCFGLLGPNGAGKTTTLEMIEGITEPDSGVILFRGEPAGAHFRVKSGIQFQKTALPDFMTCREALELFGSFYPTQRSFHALVEQCQLGEVLDRDHDRLSGGQRQRLLLALALIHDPDIIFLDEPTTGLDPQARRNFWDLVESIKKQGKTIVLTTHYMEEAYALCDQIAIMNQGQIIELGSPDQLLQKYFKEVVLELPNSDFPAALSERTQTPWTKIENVGSVTLRTTQTNASLALLLEHAACLDRLKIRPPSLDDLFLELTGKEMQP